MPPSEAAIAFLAFAAGVSLGSFLNVVILRNPAVHASLAGRSSCPSCKRTLSSWELIPIISYIALRGRCKTCNAPISVQYPVVELSMGLAAVALALPLPTTPHDIVTAVMDGIILALLIVLIGIDAQTLILPDFFIIALAVAAFVKASLVGPSNDVSSALVIGAGFMLALWAVTRGGGIGFGDVKFIIPLAILFGLPGVIVLLFGAFVAGGAVAAYLLVTRKATLKSAVPFGPYLAGAAAALVIWPHLADYAVSLLF